jgi:hypothetical protein
LGYQNYLFLELTGRVDRSSTLPKANNTYFYPSAALSFVPTDAFKLNSDVLVIRQSAGQHCPRWPRC